MDDTIIIIECGICGETWEWDVARREPTEHDEYGICDKCWQYEPNLGPDFNQVRALQVMVADLRRQIAELEIENKHRRQMRDLSTMQDEARLRNR